MNATREKPRCQLSPYQTLENLLYRLAKWQWGLRGAHASQRTRTGQF